MNPHHHFDTNAAAQRETTQIWEMIGELHRSVQLLDCDVAREEDRIFNRSGAAYPILARSLAAGHDNLMDTIEALKKRLPSPDQGERAAEVA